MASELALAQLIERTMITAIITLLAWAICAATEAFRHPPAADRSAEPPLPVSHRLAMALRANVGAEIAVFASHALGADFPEWAAMGALAVLQGTHLHISMNRALQRTVGTTFGAVLAWVLLIQEPSVWTIIAALIALQILTEVVIGANYALGQVLVTPMALLMTYLAAPQAGPEMAPERVLDMLLGAVVGISIAVLLSSIQDRRRLARHQARLEEED